MDADELRKTIGQQGQHQKEIHRSAHEDRKTNPVKEKQVSTNPQLLFSWNAPLRAYKRKSAGVLRFYIALALLLSLIVFFFGERILVLPIWATLFLVYVLTITPPQNIENKITRFGIESAGNTYRWDFLSHFYFVQKFDYTVLVIVSVPPYNHHAYLVIKDTNTREVILHLLSEYIIYQEEPHKTFTDKMTEWLTKLMPDHEAEPSLLHDEQPFKKHKASPQAPFSKPAAQPL